MTELSSYNHLSPDEIKGLSFRVTIRPLRSAVCEALGGDLLSKDIAWQEKVGKESGPSNGDNQHVCIFTYTNADIATFEGESQTDQKCYSRDEILAVQGFPLREEACFSRGKHSPRDKLKDRMLREDSCKIMAIMASAESREIVLCVVKLYPTTGLLYSCPALSETETEDLDDTSIFMSSRSIDEVICKGTRLGTYSFTAVKSVYEYMIEWNGARALDEDLEVMIAEQDIIRHVAVEERRDHIRKEFDSFDCMYENADDDPWKNLAHVEIISADGFAEPNILLCMPLGSNIAVHYRVLKLHGQIKKGDDVVLKGATSYVQRYSVPECLEFVTSFVAAFICLMFAILLSLGDFGDEFVRWSLLSIVPLALMISSRVFGDITVHHFNHQFSILYSNEAGKIVDDPPLLIELRAYFKHNFGLTSLAGCGTIALPADPGNYDVCAPMWKPIACRPIGATRFHLHDFFLGSCLSEINPMDPVPTSCSEAEMVKDVNVKLLSKGGLLTDGCGTVNVRIHVSRKIPYHVDSVSRRRHAGINPTVEKSQQHRVRMRETVDEVLSRIRRNKRCRMSRVDNSL